MDKTWTHLFYLLWMGHTVIDLREGMIEVTGLAEDGTPVHIGSIYPNIKKMMKADTASVLAYLSACPNQENW